jgi:predicted metal-dependent peptidase
MDHVHRKGHREHDLWNIACDLVVNPVLRGAGLDLPKGHIMPGQASTPWEKLPEGLSAEATYQWLLDNMPPNPQQQGEGEGEGDGGGEGEGEDEDEGGAAGEGQQPTSDPGQCGATMKPKAPPSPAEISAERAEWEVAVAQAEQVAKQRGDLSDGIKRMIVEALKPKVDWRAVLREFITKYSKNDYTWMPPNRRFVHRRLYLPSLRSEELGEVVISLDTSGSISDKTLAAFLAEINGIIEGFPDCKLTILYHTTQVYETQEWMATDGPCVLRQTHSGGTSHRDVFNAVEQLPEPPVCVVCLTDLYTDFPETAPPYPVLWAVVDNENPQAPWGQIVKVEDL